MKVLALPQPFDAPRTAEIHELTPKQPLVRLNALQSAVGTLIVTGITTLVWESVEGATGSESISGATLGAGVSTRGNRPLVCFSEGRGLLALRHLGLLRRALFFGEEAAEIGVQLHRDTLGLQLPAPGLRNVLLISRVGRQIELRSDAMPISMDIESIPEAFGFKMSANVPHSNEGF